MFRITVCAYFDGYRQHSKPILVQLKCFNKFTVLPVKPIILKEVFLGDRWK